MQRLFWKIFISFWLTLLLFAGATMYTTSIYLDNMRAQQNASSLHNRIVLFINEAQLIADTSDVNGLKDWIQEIDKTEAAPFLLIDDSGSDILQRPVSSRLKKYLERIRKQYLSASYQLRAHRRPIIVPGGSSYILIPDFQSITLARVMQRPRVIAVPLLLSALASGLVCLLLARYLSAPLNRLSQASKQLAAGNLSQRVAPSMGRRRDEIADLANDFDNMAEKLERLLTSQKQLLRDVSHELRSPLARLQAALGLSRQRHNDESDAELDRIELEVERLNDLIGSLLSLTKLESDDVQINREPLYLEEMLNEVAEDAAYEAAAHSLEVKILKSEHVQILANSILLHSAFDNIVRNAIKYTPPGTSVEVSMQKDRNAPGWVSIEVRDYGPGVPDNMLTKLFEPFVRVDEARNRQSGGYGLGLAIAMRAVQSHGGVISAHNAQGGGLSVIIRLPALSKT
ncbi:MAG: ATP-binding protein [Gammaproteobacteria bacterium]|nr:ATP-binding protein [Gammaproteobacteria bacterium]